MVASPAAPTSTPEPSHGHTTAPVPTQSTHAEHRRDDLRQPLAAGAALPRPDRRAGRLRRAVHARAVAHRHAHGLAGRDADHAARPGARRRRDGREPADHGDHRRLRDVRVPDRRPGPSRRARVALARERQRAQGEARDGDRRHLVDPPAAHVHRGRGAHREGAALADGDPHHVPALGARAGVHRPHVAAADARSRPPRHAPPPPPAPEPTNHPVSVGRPAAASQRGSPRRRARSGRRAPASARNAASSRRRSQTSTTRRSP